ncbi:MAG: site-specific integrase, partial [Chthoniobacterales bacterium]
MDYRAGKLGLVQVDGRRNGSGKREYFSQPAAALVRAEQIALTAQNQGISALNFPERDRVMAVEARDLLAPLGHTIRDATAHFIRHLQAERQRSTVPTIRDAGVEYILARQHDHERGDIAKRTIDSLRQAVTQLIAAVGDLRISDFDSDQLRTYLNALRVSAKSRQDIRLRLSGMLSYAVSKKWLSANPCSGVKIRVPRQEIVVLSVDACANLLRAAEESKHAAHLVPYVACCLLGSLRPFECQNLDWSKIDFETAHLHVIPSSSKKREGRFVAMEPALVAFLKLYAKPSGPVVSRNHRKQWESLIRSCGHSAANPWPQDCMRHTGISMLLALKRNRALVTEEAGTSLSCLKRNYLSPIKAG